jgi:hypothetical protein
VYKQVPDSAGLVIQIQDFSIVYTHAPGTATPLSLFLEVELNLDPYPEPRRNQISPVGHHRVARRLALAGPSPGLQGIESVAVAGYGPTKGVQLSARFSASCSAISETSEQETL